MNQDFLYSTFSAEVKLHCRVPLDGFSYVSHDYYISGRIEDLLYSSDNCGSSDDDDKKFNKICINKC